MVLQIYILIKDPHAVQITDNSVLITGDTAFDPILKQWILIVSIVASLISLAWSLVVYHRSLRLAKKIKIDQCTYILFHNPDVCSKFILVCA